ncbi:MAG: 3'-5' exonuclease [Phototrophicaceae bacterium]
MIVDRDTLLIIDLEATCWKKHKNPEGEISEIIEIGICEYHLPSATIRHQKGILVQPTESQVSPFCTALTTITPQLLADEGLSFIEACAILQAEYQADNRLWLSWGNYDRRMMISQCERRNILYPLSDYHCNLKNLFANFYSNRLGLKAALDKIKLDLQGTHHRGVDDAVNIARILQFLITTHGVDILDSFWE